ncbi:hypothetical protein GQ457_10G009540 [Hibiscus cannabinus]
MLCEKDLETTLHAVSECPATQEVFALCGMDYKLPQGPFVTSKSWIDAVVQVLDESQLRLLLVLIWNIWNRRNMWVHQTQLIPAKLVADYAQMVATEIQDATEAPLNPVPGIVESRWKKPTPGYIKINVDGAWSQEMNLATVGVVARDHHGMVIDARVARVEGSHTAETIEAYAFAGGIRMELSNDWQMVKIEGDAMVVVAKLNAPSLDRSVAASYLGEAWEALRANSEFTVHYTNRSCNQVAHNLAHWMFTLIEHFVFFI